MNTPPLLLLIGGHDPSGGAGLQADIETAAALGCRATSLVTCLTTQDSRNVQSLHPQRPQDLQAQLELLLADMQPDVIKIGLLGDATLARLLAEHLHQLQIPLVLDPVLAAGGGSDLASEELIAVIREHWLPISTLITPNRAEARRLSGLEDAHDAAQWLLQAGCQQVLLTGADEATGEQVRNTLFSAHGEQHFDWPLLPHSYHGSGCTLASACACELALGRPASEAVERAQQFTWNALQAAERPGRGQHLPMRRSQP